MKIADIRKCPTVIENIPAGNCNGVHESILRSYQILEKVKYYLDEYVPAKIILELINEMETKE